MNEFRFIFKINIGFNLSTSIKVFFREPFCFNKRKKMELAAPHLSLQVTDASLGISINIAITCTE